MKYVLGKSNGFNATVKSDSGSLNEYWELGWELGGSRLLLIKDLIEGNVSKTDTIITLKDRMFLYENLFTNVLAFEDFDGEADHRYSDYNYVEPRLKEIEQNEFFFKDENNLSYVLNTPGKKNLEKPYFVVHFRQRPHGKERNIDVQSYVNLFDSLIRKGFDFIVYGKDSGDTCSLYSKTETTLNEANQYLKGDNCLGFIGPVSGGSMIALLSSEKDHHIIDTSMTMMNPSLDKHPLYHGSGPNYIKAKIHYYRSMENFIQQI